MKNWISYRPSANCFTSSSFYVRLEKVDSGISTDIVYVCHSPPPPPPTHSPPIRLPRVMQHSAYPVRIGPHSAYHTNSCHTHCIQSQVTLTNLRPHSPYPISCHVYTHRIQSHATLTIPSLMPRVHSLYPNSCYTHRI